MSHPRALYICTYREKCVHEGEVSDSDVTVGHLCRDAGQVAVSVDGEQLTLFSRRGGLPVAQKNIMLFKSLTTLLNSLEKKIARSTHRTKNYHLFFLIS